LASGADEAARDWLDLSTRWVREHAVWRANTPDHLRAAAIWLLGARILRPTYAWLTNQRATRFLPLTAELLDPAGFEHLDELAGADPRIRNEAKRLALNRLTWILIAKSGNLTDITLGDLVELHRYLLTAQQRWKGRSISMAYQLLRTAGYLDTDTPPTFRVFTTTGPLDAAALIDRYQLSCRPVRDLLVDYLTERAPSLDYSTLETVAFKLGRCFWKDLEEHHPGIDSLALPPDVATAWKLRLGSIRDANGVKRPRLNAPDILTQAGRTRRAEDQPRGRRTETHHDARDGHQTRNHPPWHARLPVDLRLRHPGNDGSVSLSV
jgi:hypothetical protein